MKYRIVVSVIRGVRPCTSYDLYPAGVKASKLDRCLATAVIEVMPHIAVEGRCEVLDFKFGSTLRSGQNRAVIRARRFAPASSRKT